jgi:type IV pilus assembly protein PilZ
VLRLRLRLRPHFLARRRLFAIRAPRISTVWGKQAHVDERCFRSVQSSDVSMEKAVAPQRSTVLQLAIKEKAALIAAYIPYFSEGGLFIPTSREHRLGDELFVLLTLPTGAQRHPIAGRVAWITPSRSAGGRLQGVGIRFPTDEKSKVLKSKIEEYLGAHLLAEYQSQTI